jgi:predicted CXXCH cytochrome family protein
VKSYRCVKYIIFTTLFSFSLSAEQTEILKIIHPSEARISEENIISVVIETQNTSLDSMIISNDMNETFHININSSRTHYCKKITLHLGENNISVSGYNGTSLVKQEKRTVFLTSKVDREYRYPPKDYSTNYFHNDGNEKICSKCHDMRINEVPGVAFEDISTSNCYQCHSSITTKKHAHAPAVNWLCTSCHNGKVGIYNQADENKSKYTFPDPIGEVCLSCHKKNKELWATKRFNHEPADSGRCNKCHNSHSENSEFYLRKPAWELCTGCHKDKVDGVHIVKTFSRVMHPTHQVKDPSRPGKDLSCTSCHNPHVSNAPSLLQSDSVFGLCERCHKK